MISKDNELKKKKTETLFEPLSQSTKNSRPQAMQRPFSAKP